MKLVLRSGGRVEIRDPFRRSPAGFQNLTASQSDHDRFKMKEMMTIGAIARSIHKLRRGPRHGDCD
ncbi:MAG: hypothetical protein GXX93_10175 [Anaerolineae bacterium]|nr:hypothetical protein [Anaerolineae bacterium]